MSWGDAQFDSAGDEPLVPREPRTFRPVAKAALFYAGIVLPCICFAATGNGPVDSPTWQSGRLSDYFAFLLTARTGFVYFPLLLFSMLSFCAVVFNVRGRVDSPIVRFGVCTGVVLAFHFSVLLFVVTFHVTWPCWELLLLPLVIVAANLAPIIGFYIVRSAATLLWFFAKTSEGIAWIVFGLFGFLVLGWLCLGAAQVYDPAGVLFIFPVAVFALSSLFANAYWAFGAYLAVAIHVARRHGKMQFRLAHLLVVFTWLAAYLAATRVAVQLALNDYATLPTSPTGGCYIATAAARGHRRFVGARAISLGSGRTLWVNRQLVTLKCGELVIRALFPRGHRAMRAVYDWFGPRLASQITHPLLADAVYLSLKPCEWFARSLLAVLVPRNAWHCVSRIYPGEPSDNLSISHLDK